MPAIKQTKDMQDLAIKIRELQEQHNRLTTRCLLLEAKMQKMMAFVEYREPELTPEEKTKRMQAVETFKRGTQPTVQRSLKSIDN